MIAIISGCSADRTRHISGVCAQLAGQAAEFGVELGEVAWIRDGALASAVSASRLRLARQQIALRRIAVTAGDPSARSIRSTLQHSLVHWPFRRGRDNRLTVFRREIEVTYKHVLAWQMAAQCDDEWLLVLEDDASLGPEWQNPLRKVIDVVTASPTLQGVVLGGVCEWPSTLGARLPSRKHDAGIHVPYLVGNGGVGYLWRTALVGEVLRCLASIRNREIIPADWLTAAVSHQIGVLPHHGWMLVPDESPIVHGTFASLIQRS